MQYTPPTSAMNGPHITITQIAYAMTAGIRSDMEDVYA